MSANQRTSPSPVPLAAAPEDEIEVVDLTDVEDMRDAATLYRRVFGYRDAMQTLNPRLLMTLPLNGGQVLGVRDAHGTLIAFSYGYPGKDGEQLYLFSQAVVVDGEVQGQGIGRAVKEAQRQRALAVGLERMRWTFDPVLGRNAHFNTDVLGAIGIRFVENLTGPGADRIVVEWDLAHGRPAWAVETPAAVATAVARIAESAVEDRPLVDAVEVDDDATLVLIPATPLADLDPDVGDVARDALRTALLAANGAGHVLTSATRLDEATTVLLWRRPPSPAATEEV